MSKQHMATGTVVFSNVQSHDFYNGKDTGKFALTITLDEASANQLVEQGVKLKEYDENFQRRFVTKTKPKVIDLDDMPVGSELPRGSTVRVLYTVGDEYNGSVPVYMNAIRVVELAEAYETPEEF